jgi:hypothetical protein
VAFDVVSCVNRPRHCASRPLIPLRRPASPRFVVEWPSHRTHPVDKLDFCATFLPAKWSTVDAVLRPMGTAKPDLLRPTCRQGRNGLLRGAAVPTEPHPGQCRRVANAPASSAMNMLGEGTFSTTKGPSAAAATKLMQPWTARARHSPVGGGGATPAGRGRREHRPETAMRNRRHRSCCERFFCPSEVVKNDNKPPRRVVRRTPFLPRTSTMADLF